MPLNRYGHVGASVLLVVGFEVLHDQSKDQYLPAFLHHVDPHVQFSAPSPATRVPAYCHDFHHDDNGMPHLNVILYKCCHGHIFLFTEIKPLRLERWFSG